MAKTSRYSSNRKTWNPEEDSLLIQYITTHGEGNWASLPLRAGLKRRGKSCRLRWFNYLHPNIKRGSFSQDEDELIIRLHRLLGNRWSLIAKRLPGRTDNDVKNYWNTHLCKKLRGKEDQPSDEVDHSRVRDKEGGRNVVENGDERSRNSKCDKKRESVSVSVNVNEEAGGSFVDLSCVIGEELESHYHHSMHYLKSEELISTGSFEHDLLLLGMNSETNSNLFYQDGDSPLLSADLYDLWGNL